jgi:hypothetical protein
MCPALVGTVGTISKVNAIVMQRDEFPAANRAINSRYFDVAS